MRNIKKLEPYMEIIKKGFIEQAEYQIDFYLRCLYEIALVIVNMGFFDIIYLHTETIGTWTLNEIKILVLVSALLDGFITFFCVEGLNRLPQLIDTGELDYILLKPVNKRIYISFYKVCASQIFSISFFFIYLLVLLVKEGYTIIQFLIFIFMTLISLVILYCMFFCIMCLSFWTVRVDIGVSLFFQLFTVGNKPLEIYPEIAKKILSFLIPIGLAINYPVLSFRNIFTIRHLLEECVVGIGIFILSQCIFKKGLQKYESVG